LIDCFPMLYESGENESFWFGTIEEFAEKNTILEMTRIEKDIIEFLREKNLISKGACDLYLSDDEYCDDEEENEGVSLVSLILEFLEREKNENC